MLKDDLIREYTQFKAALMVGCRKADLSDMTDREQAGLRLQLFGCRAVGAFARALAGVKPNAADPWPNAEQLVRQALQEGGS